MVLTLFHGSPVYVIRPPYRFDWNLLSTASPAIDAWLNPSNRLANAVSALLSGYKKRVTAVMACVMTDALDTPGMHFVFKVRPGVLDIFSG